MPVNETETRTPSPDGILLPVRENPNTVDSDVLNVNPASAAEPPEAPVILMPDKSN